MLPMTITTHILTDQTLGATNASGIIGTGGNAAFSTKGADQIYVIDWISYANSASSTDTWTLTVFDDNARPLLVSVQAVTGPDNMFLQFVGGLPLRNILSDANQAEGKSVTATPAVSITTASTTTGTLVVGYHTEHRAHRNFAA